MKKVKIILITEFLTNYFFLLQDILNRHPQIQAEFVPLRVEKGSTINSFLWQEGAKPKRFALIRRYFRNFRTLLSSLFCPSSFFFTTRYAAIIPYVFRKPYIYWCHGADLDYGIDYGIDIFSYEKFTKHKNPLVRLPMRVLCKIGRVTLRKVISRAPVCMPAPYQLKQIKTIGFRGLSYAPHILSVEYINFDISSKESIKRKVCREFGCSQYFFSSTRQAWKTIPNKESISSDVKNSHIMIKAFHKYLSETNKVDTKLILIKLGHDCDASVELIKKLGIESRVVWLDPMPRKKMLELYAGADICFGQFHLTYITLCDVEAMACGTPVITYFEKSDISIPYYDELPPVAFSSKDSSEIVQLLHKFDNDAELQKELQQSARAWVERNCSYENIQNRFLEIAKLFEKNSPPHQL